MSQPADGGVAQVVADLVRGQVADGHRVVLACPAEGRLAPVARAAGAQLRGWSARRAPGPGLPGEVAALRRIVADTDPQLVHLHSAKAGLAGRLAVRGARPTVFQPHAWSFAAVGGPTARAARAWERWATRWTDRLLCVSEQERREGEAAGLRGRWALAPNGLDLDRYDSARLPVQAQARTALRLEPQGPLAVCVGRLCRQKGQDVLLRAWAGVPGRVPGARLALVGDGPDRAALEALAGALPDPGSVLFAGHAEDPRDWYAAADLMVLPSRWEGMALAPLEAMACSRPVLLTDVSGARECLPQGSPAPLPVEDPDALREALVQRLSDREACRREGLRAWLDVFDRRDVRLTRQRVARVYDEVLGEARDASRQASPNAHQHVDGHKDMTISH
ncbi:glycosyltransferase [Streptacidiphilus sp. PB12-B1b]|uniref:glycosyltransferase n=1 Tax=Streptacidiphilus sp. PB12-B1b TaxID=2705012 RepID=UPI00351A93D2